MDAPTLQPDAPSRPRSRTGLVLEGGAMRGLYTAGVLDVLMENGLDRCIDGAIGVSAGATFGCNLKSHQIGRVVRYNIRFCTDWRYCSWRSLLLTGDLYGGEFCYETLPFELDLFDTAAFAANPLPFWCVATDCRTGDAVYRRLDAGDRDDVRWLQASASMPAVSRPVVIDGVRYLDGGISDSIPLAAFEGMEFTRNVVVLTQPAGFRKQHMRTGRALGRLLGMPAVGARLDSRWRDYNAALDLVAAREAAGLAFVFRPAHTLPVDTMSHDADKLRQAYNMGRDDAEARLADLRVFLGASEGSGGLC